MIHPRVVAGLLFASGFCALTYQVAWFRALRLIFGASTASNAAVLAIFMGGLGLGGWLLGPRADRHPRPLALYARLELGIAVLAGISPLLVEGVRAAYLSFGGPMALSPGVLAVLKLLLATLVLGGPVVLMGGTLPAAVRACQTDADASRRSLALVYGANTLGSVAGATLGTFFLLELLGTRATLLGAALLNVLVALVALRLSREGDGLVAPAEDAPAPVAATSARPPLPFVLTAALISGFAFFLMELVWYRMLGPILGGSVYTFGLILIFALAGIGIGGLLYSRRPIERPTTLTGFALTCGSMALLLALPYALGDSLALAALFLRSLDHLGFGGLVLGWALIDAVVVLPAAIVAGYQFPMLVSLVGSGAAKVGREVGLTYAWNTVGAILGALAGGFGVLPLLTAPGAWSLVVALLGTLGLTALVLDRGTPLTRRVLPIVVIAAAGWALTATGPTSVWRHGGIGAGRAPARFASATDLAKWMSARRRAIVWEADGTESSVALEDASSFAFVVGGKSDGNARGDAPTQTMLGLLGAALHPAPKSTFVIGLGTGATAGWLAAVPSVEKVDVVELEPVVLRVAEQCGPVNEGAMQSPKVNVIIGDAREVLPTATTTYDIVVSEPSNPYRAGISSLFTLEFYESVSEKLNDGGLLVQWVQAYDIDGATIRTIVTTIAQVFPVIEIWESQVEGDLILVAARSPWQVDAAALEARLGTEPFLSGIRRVWGVEGLHGFYSGHVASPLFSVALAKEGMAQGEICTDDSALVEFGFARTVGQGQLGGVRGLRTAAEARGLDLPVSLTGRTLDPVLIRERWQARVVAEGLGDADRPLPDGPDPKAARTRQEARSLYGRGLLRPALQRWQEQAEPFGDPREPPNTTDLTLIAEGLVEAGRPEALTVLTQLRERAPLTADAILARYEVRHGDAAKGKALLLDVLTRYRQDPWPLPTVMGRLFDVAEVAAADDPAFASAVVAAMSERFAVGMLDERRKLIRLLVGLAGATRPGPEGTATFGPECVLLFAETEPWVPWDEGVLANRVRCYAAHAPEKVDAAQRDLEAWARDLEAPLLPR